MIKTEETCFNKKSLRIVTWNCNGALRKKWRHLKTIRADIYIVQECEDPAQARDAEYIGWSEHFLWTGTSKNKGIGIFSGKDFTLMPIPMNISPLELFLPCVVNGSFPLLATWTKQANSPNFGYIGQLWKFLQSHGRFLDHPQAMLIGDLNSNAVWDEWDRWWNHTDVVTELSNLGLQSCYHRHFSEKQGKETCPTFYLHRKLEKPHHIDYAFAGPQWIIRNVEVGNTMKWLEHSDHLPVLFDLASID